MITLAGKGTLDPIGNNLKRRTLPPAPMMRIAQAYTEPLTIAFITKYMCTYKLMSQNTQNTSVPESFGV